MTFEEKKLLIEQARSKYLSFDDYFKELLGSGMSTAGAYSAVDLKLIEEHETINELKLWDSPTATVRDSSPTRLGKYSIVKKLEELDERLSNTK